jgi:F-type H+-transporting ATPase subunit delta
VSTKARPQDYAAAIYDLAFETWTRQLDNVQEALKRDAALRAALVDPAKSTPDKLALLDQALPAGLDPAVRKFLGTLFEAGQFDQFDAILAEFERMIRRRPERKLARVTTAVPLTDAEKEALRTRLAKRFGSDLEFEYNVDASLIGGVHLRVGDQVVDGSVAGKLAALRDQLAA